MLSRTPRLTLRLFLAASIACLCVPAAPSWAFPRGRVSHPGGGVLQRRPAPLLPHRASRRDGGDRGGIGRSGMDAHRMELLGISGRQPLLQRRLRRAGEPLLQRLFEFAFLHGGCRGSGGHPAARKRMDARGPGIPDPAAGRAGSMRRGIGAGLSPVQQPLRIPRQQPPLRDRRRRAREDGGPGMDRRGRAFLRARVGRGADRVVPDHRRLAHPGDAEPAVRGRNGQPRALHRDQQPPACPPRSIRSCPAA